MESNADEVGSNRPAGFYCRRFVLGSTIDIAWQEAFAKVRDGLDKKTGWISSNAAVLTLEADEVRAACIFDFLKAYNRGFVFYESG